MRITTINYNELAFGTKKQFKRMFKKCCYSGEKFEQHNTKTIEHIIPLSEGGMNDYSNYLIVKRSWNEKRSSIPLSEFIKKHPQVQENIIQSVNEQEGKIINGINWSEAVKSTLTKAIGTDIFQKRQK
ncbi:HNH endonuclease [bacterium]|nr:HNH endonuclease [bacterium]